MALNPGGAISWSRNHPKSDGAILGPLLFLALAVVTSLSLWWCLLAGMLGVAIFTTSERMFIAYIIKVFVDSLSYKDLSLL